LIRAFCEQLAVFDEIDCILSRELFSVERMEPQERLTRHVRREPVPVVILAVVPEELLLRAYRIHGLDQAPGEQVGEPTHDIVHRFIQ